MRVYTIGRYPHVKLIDARAEAARLVATERGDVRVTVAEAVEQFMDNRIRAEYRRTTNAEVYARALTRSIGNLTLDNVRPKDVSRMVVDYRKRGPVASMRLLAFAKWPRPRGTCRIASAQAELIHRAMRTRPRPRSGVFVCATA